MSVKITKDRVGPLLANIERLTRSQVLIGIPAVNAGRDDDGEDGINNASLGYIHEYGAPEANIPPRPFLVPGVQNAEEAVAKALRRGAMQALEGKGDAADVALGSAGTLAEAAVRQKITDGPFAALAPKTLAARKARGVTRTNPLIDTGKLRDNITYVIRRRGE